MTGSDRQIRKGFTLIELIVSLTVAAVLGTILLVFLNSAFVRSAEPVNRAVRLADLRQVMENITADYFNLIERADVLDELERRIGSGSTDPDTGYGAYSADLERIAFSGGAEQSSPTSEVLKVTLTPAGESGPSITVLFTTAR